jgi:hypothetical protein
MVVTMMVGAAAAPAAGEWIELFDGKTLKGWSVHSGFAKYHVEDGAIVGTAVLDSPNTFLCTDHEFGDFILEFEVKVDPRLNSGVQFRSSIAGKDSVVSFEQDGKKVERKMPADRVYGYQVEIATAASASSGNVYDEARRGRFLDDFGGKPDAKTAFQDNQWNRYLVVCKGKSIRTWINGVPCADFEDGMTARGVIGLQVHGVSKKDFQPFQVRWRNLRLLKLD